MPLVRFLRPLAAIAVLVGRIPPWLATPARSEAARRREQQGFAALTRAFGIEVVIEGKPCHGGTLFVVNHVSWADIPVLGGALGAAFVAKAEVAGWPVIGSMARRIGTLFVARDRRTTTGTQADAIRARLRSGQDVLLFAEGTTSDGTGVKPFRTSLFAAADAAARVQPIALNWLAADGGVLTPERLRAVAWTGADPLLPGIVRLSAERTRALLRVTPPIDPALAGDRKALALAAHAAVVAAYAAAPNRSR